MSQSKLEELYEDPNIPPEFGTLILMINTELEKILTRHSVIILLPQDSCRLIATPICCLSSSDLIRG